MLFFCDNSDVDHQSKFCLPDGHDTTAQWVKNPHLAPSPMTNSAQW